MSHTPHPTTTADGPAAKSQTYTTFRLEGGLFGTATSVVKEVTALPPLTPVPHAPPAIRGYVNLRGHLVLVVDLNWLLERKPTPLDPESRLIVFRPELGDSFGVLAKRIGDIVELPAEQIEAHRAGQETGGSALRSPPDDELLSGVGKLAGELLSILDAWRLRPCLERAIAARGGGFPRDVAGLTKHLDNTVPAS